MCCPPLLKLSPICLAPSHSILSLSRQLTDMCWSVQDFESLPAPQSSEVELKRQGGGHFAALTFNGDADEAQVASEVC